MRFAAFLSTRDEMDVLPGAIDHLRRIGVELIVILDGGSTDGTLEYLAEVEAEGDIWLIHMPPESSAASTAGLRAAVARGLGVDWVLLAAAGDRWLPATGTLEGLMDLEAADTLSVMRLEVVTGPEGPLLPHELGPTTYAVVQLFGRPLLDPEAHLVEHPDERWVTAALGPGVMARPDVVAGMARGATDIDAGDARPARSVIARDLLIAHVPRPAPDRTEGRALTMAQLAEGREAGMVRSADEVLERLIPALRSEEEYRIAVRRAQPWLAAAGIVCRREGIAADGRLRVADSGMYPTVIVPPDRIIKFYGPWANGPDTAYEELRGLDLVTRDPELPVPRIVGLGSVDDDWEYAVFSLLPGVPFSRVRDSLAPEDLLAVAAWLGRFVRRLHAIPLEDWERTGHAAWFSSVIAQRRTDAARLMAQEGVLPDHLIAQLDDWLPTADEMTTRPEDAVLLNGDLHDEHILGDHTEGRFTPTGVIDFNRARIGHPLYELGPIWAWVLQGDRHLMAAFLAEAQLPGADDPGFPRLALAWCIVQAHLLQRRLLTPPYARSSRGSHVALRRAVDLDSVRSLDELATRSFGLVVRSDADLSPALPSSRQA